MMVSAVSQTFDCDWISMFICVAGIAEIGWKVRIRRLQSGVKTSLVKVFAAISFTGSSCIFVCVPNVLT